MEDEETAVEMWKEEEEEAESHFDFVLAVVSRLGFARRRPSVARRSTISITPGEFAGLPCARNEIA